MLGAMTWLPPEYLDRLIREILAERMEHGATDKRDRRPTALVDEDGRIERAGWVS